MVWFLTMSKFNGFWHRACTKTYVFILFLSLLYVFLYFFGMFLYIFILSLRFLILFDEKYRNTKEESKKLPRKYKILKKSIKIGFGDCPGALDHLDLNQLAIHSVQKSMEKITKQVS